MVVSARIQNATRNGPPDGYCGKTNVPRESVPETASGVGLLYPASASVVIPLVMGAIDNNCRPGVLDTGLALTLAINKG